MTRNATPAEVDRARAAGADAYAAGSPNAPGVDPTIREMLVDVPVGEPRTLTLFNAFSEAYSQAAVLAHRKYRKVPAAEAGYTGPQYAGKWQVQHQDPGMPWFDHGDPLDEDLAQARLTALRG